MEQKLSPDRERNLTAKYVALFPDKRLRQQIAEMPSNQRRALLRDKLISEAAKQGIPASKLISSNKKFFTVNVNGNEVSINQSDKLGKAVDLLDKAALKEKKPEISKPKVKPVQRKPEDEKDGVRKNFSLFFTFDPKVHPMMRDPNISFQAKMAYLRQQITNQLLAQGVTPEEMVTLPNRINIVGSSSSAILSNAKGRNMVECLAIFYHSYYSALKTPRERELIKYAQKQALMDVFDDPVQFLDDIRESLGMQRVYNKKDNKAWKNFDVNDKNIDFEKIEEAQKLDIEQAANYKSNVKYNDFVAKPEPPHTYKIATAALKKVFTLSHSPRIERKMAEMKKIAEEMKKFSAEVEGKTVTYSANAKPTIAESWKEAYGGEYNDAVMSAVSDMSKDKGDASTLTVDGQEYSLGKSGKEVYEAVAKSRETDAPVEETKVVSNLDVNTSLGVGYTADMAFATPAAAVSSSDVSISYVTSATSSIYAQSVSKKPKFRLMKPQKIRAMIEHGEKSTPSSEESKVEEAKPAETKAPETSTSEASVSPMSYTASPLGTEYTSFMTTEYSATMAEAYITTTADPKVEKFKDIDAVQTLIDEGVPPAEASTMAGKKPKTNPKKLTIKNKPAKLTKNPEKENEQEEIAALTKND